MSVGAGAADFVRRMRCQLGRRLACGVTRRSERPIGGMAQWTGKSWSTVAKTATRWLILTVLRR